MDIKCKKCGCEKLFTEEKGNNIGIYCAGCGSWIKWGKKEEIRLINRRDDSVSKEEVVNCDFCKEIYDYDKLKGMSLWESIENSIPGNLIEHRGKDDSYGIWNECDDGYYSGRIMRINYCPVCGRKLSTK